MPVIPQSIRRASSAKTKRGEDMGVRFGISWAGAILLTAISSLATAADPCDCDIQPRLSDNYLADQDTGGQLLETDTPPPTVDEASPNEADPSPIGAADLGFSQRSGASVGSETAVSFFPGTYIDSAIVGNQFRFRFDAAYNNGLPDRAEFFYPQCGCFPGDTPGPARVETSVDYQEFMGYLELALTDRLSGFVEIPFRLLNPEQNDNTSGLGDIRSGFKYALIADPRHYLTFQLKVYAPSGDGDRGLGTAHASIEPGILYYRQVSNIVDIFAEVRDWIPISDSEFGGRDYAGNVLRYGVGAGFNLLEWTDDCCRQQRVALVTEFVGWSILGGQALQSFDGIPQNAKVIDVDGQTIVNAKVGLRYSNADSSFGVSYGRGLTGDVWYSDILRVEYRYAF